MKTLPAFSLALFLLGGLLMNTNGAHNRQQEGSSLYKDVVPAIPSTIPPKVSLPKERNRFQALQLRPFYDNFSWKTFLSLCWPADPGAERGTARNPGNESYFRNAHKSGEKNLPTVWLSYRTGDELFPVDGSDPVSWEAPEKETRALLLQIEKASLIKATFDEAVGGPLIDQNRQYTRFVIHINRIQYDAIRSNRWYLREALEKAIGSEGIELPAGSIELKSAWRRMIEKEDLDPEKPWLRVDDQTRYYVVETTTLVPQDDGSVQNERGKWGLVGFHIGMKTAGYPGWVWATFEQVDNISTEAGSGRRPSYNNGTDDPPPNALGYDYNPKRNIPPFAKSSERNPVQVTRLVPIPSTPRDPAGYSTADLNHRYRKLLQGTVWEYYELVGTQWALQPAQRTPYNPEYNFRNYTGDLAGTPFPSQLSNTTMETYIQTQSSCMQCHYHAAALGTDFSWIMPKRAYPVR